MHVTCWVRRVYQYLPCRLRYLPDRTDRVINNLLYLIIQAHFGRFCCLILSVPFANAPHSVSFRLTRNKFTGSLYLRIIFVIFIAMQFKFLRALVAHFLLELLAQAILGHSGAAVRRFAREYPWVRVFVTVPEPFRYCCCVEPMSSFTSGERYRTAPMIGSESSHELKANAPPQRR